MTVAFQPTLFGSLDAEESGCGPTASLTGVRRRQLTRGAWIDVLPGWLEAADDVFAEMIEHVPWRAEKRPMYERVVDVPRLLCHYGAGEVLPHPALERARDALSQHYADELGEPFVTAGCCYYRDGNDSVAWHGDNLGRGRTTDTMVAIVSLGSPRRLSLRPRGGGQAIHHLLGHGDLIVMGGSCQRTWEHAVLKTARPVGPRISVQFRPRGVL
jgi:alkylated DNA repair dioxygenase AlkB